MDDKLILGLPDTNAEAPKERFEPAERGTRVNSAAALPLLIGAFVALVRQFFADEKAGEVEEEPQASPHPRQISEIDEVASTPVDGGEVTDGADLAKVVRIADYLNRLSSGDVAGDLDLSSFYSGGRDTLPPNTFERSTVGTDPSSPSETSGIGASGSSGSGGSGGSSGLPTANDNDPEPTSSDETDRPGETDGEDDSETDGTQTDDESDDDDPQTPPVERQNRRPVLAGPVFLDGGLLNLSIIITMAELLTGASDPDGDVLVARQLEADVGQLQRIGIDRWLYTPAQDAVGPVTFRYQISDGVDEVVQTAQLVIRLPHPAEIVGTEHDDLLLGTPQVDLVDARGGDDIVYGRESDDVIYGGAGNDRLIGGEGDDILWGGLGDDLLYGGLGHDTLQGEAGNDLLYGEAGNDVLLGGTGDDEAYGGEGDDVIEGDEGDDTLYGDAGADQLDGDEGDDILHGGVGADILSGGAGDDTLSGGDDADALDGGTGADILLAGAGDDRAHGGDGEDRLESGEGDDVLYGEADDDILLGQAGDDEVHGGDGDDRIEGGTGDDVLRGEAGDDRVDGDAGKDLIIDGEGADHIEAGEGDDCILFLSDGEIDRVEGGAGSDTLDLTQIVFDSRVDLAAGILVVQGVEEARIFEIENVKGGRGRDELVADDEVNVFVGGDGDDTFVFRTLDALTNSGGPRDHVMDFKIGDRIDLSRLIRDPDDFAAQKLFFAGMASASPAELGGVTFENRFSEDDEEITIVIGQLDEDEEADFEIVLLGHHELTERDFILAARADQHD